MKRQKQYSLSFVVLVASFGSAVSWGLSSRQYSPVQRCEQQQRHATSHGLVVSRSAAGGTRRGRRCGEQERGGPLFLSKRTSTKSSESSSRSSSDSEDPEDKVSGKSFDEAGASLIEAADKERMEQMGDYDINPNYKSDKMERMREAIRARTAEMGLEKSKVSADYIAAKKEQAMRAGPPGAVENPDTFGGLDLSRISAEADGTGADRWNEEMPTMFYDPEEEMSTEEQEEVDPMMKLSPIDQGINELSNAKWPDPLSALREVGVMVLVVIVTAVIIIGWDKVLRGLYTDIGFIPTKEDLMNYAARFDGLDLPEGWTNNMSEEDFASLADKVNQIPSSGLPDL